MYMLCLAWWPVIVFGDSIVIFHIQSLRATAFSTVNMVVVCIKNQLLCFSLHMYHSNKSIHNPLIFLLPPVQRKPKTIILICIATVSGSGFTVLVSSMLVLIENQLENRVEKKKRERNGKWVASLNSPQLFQLHLKRPLLSRGWPYCVRRNQKAFCAPFAKHWDGFIHQPCKQAPDCFCSHLLHRS